jgi:hypothetical protein
MDEFFYAGTDEGDAEQVPAVLVDDHAGAAGAAVGVQSGPGHRLAGRWISSRRTTESGTG